MQLRFHTEVCHALEAGLPVVALESSVIAQGLPRPHNLEAARACEAAVRRSGAVPATVALIDGEPWAGLTDGQLQRLASGTEPLVKVGSRDLAMAIAKRQSGGTTVSATCEIASAAGIRIFATGGLGGVHRGAEEHFDISQDLGALARFPVAVVCAGAKSVLDLPKTLELLETLSVPVVGVGTNAFPAFFSIDSGLSLEHRVDDLESAARLLRARFDDLGQGGLLLALPPPSATAIPKEEVEALVETALEEAAVQGIRGKAVTPHLLGALARASGGRTLAANLALLEHNAAYAGRLAVALAQR